MEPKDAYYGIDRLQAECEAIAEARDKWVAIAVKGMVRTWKTELAKFDLIEEMNIDSAHIMKLAIESQISFDDQLESIANDHAVELFDNLSWDEK